MRGISTELLYVLAFVAIGLARYLWERLRRVRPWEERLARQRRAEAEAAAASGPPPPEVAVPPAPRPADAPPPREDREHGARARPVPQRQALRRDADLRDARTHESAWRAARLRADPSAVPGGDAARRRFSRRALFGDRRRTQDAVVAATILGPCRATAPYYADR